MNPEEYGRMADLEGVQWWYAGMRRIARALLTPLLSGRGEGRRYRRCRPFLGRPTWRWALRS